MSTISIHLANTATGEYDVRLPLPKPLHCDPATGRITRRQAEYDIDQVIGFTSDPDEFEVDITWQEWVASDPVCSAVIEGMFPVVTHAGGMATLTLPVTRATEASAR